MAGLEDMFGSIWIWILTFFDQLIPVYIVPNLQLIIQVLIILVFGYISGRIVKIAVVKILGAVGLKRITTRTWAESVLKATGYRGNFVELIGDLVKWLVYVLFLALIIQTVGLPGIANVFTDFAVFMPRFIGAIFIIAIGFIIADFFGKIFEEAARKFFGEEVLSALSGGLAKYSIALISIIMSLALLGLDVSSILIIFVFILAVFGIVIYMGLKDVFPNFAAGVQIKNTLKPGEKITVGKYTGIVESVGPVSVVLKDGEKMIEIPHIIFVKKPVTKHSKKKK